ncbi:hypothetical protein WKI68_05785 [Streptomyces sp. MS1.HAVA.3]|uniref:Uncharacterized protein n=1 Tax=Streptomyces caledonius TaxID=3134107 RepID=A0ABU8TZR0_9ACTN
MKITLWASSAERTVATVSSESGAEASTPSSSAPMNPASRRTTTGPTRVSASVNSLSNNDTAVELHRLSVG